MNKPESMQMIHRFHSYSIILATGGLDRVHFYYSIHWFAPAPQRAEAVNVIDFFFVFKLSLLLWVPTHIYMLNYTNSAFLLWPDVARAIELLEKLQESGDVPGHKLQSLKKVLQSEFCTAIREVSQDCWGRISPFADGLTHATPPY